MWFTITDNFSLNTVISQNKKEFELPAVFETFMKHGFGYFLSLINFFGYKSVEIIIFTLKITEQAILMLTKVSKSEEIHQVLPTYK